MTNLNFMLTRTLGRTLAAGDEIVVTRLDHDANVAPVARARARPRARRPLRGRPTTTSALDLDDLERTALGPHARRRVPGGRELGRHGARRAPGRRARARRGRARLGRRRPLRAARPDRRRRLGLRRARLLAVQVLRPAPRARVRASRPPGRRGVRTRCGPSANEPVGRRFETGTLPARAARRLRRRRRLRRTSSAGTRSSATSARSASASSPACPRASRCTGCRRWRAACRPSASRSPATRPRQAAVELAARDLAVWHGNYYALETMRALGLDDESGAVRAGIVHYNTAEEVDRLLAALGELCGS